MHLFYGGLNFTETNSIGAGIGKFVHDRSLFLQIWSWASDQGNNVLEWLKQPREQLPEWIGQDERWLTRPADVLALIMAWWITFTVVLLLLFNEFKKKVELPNQGVYVGDSTSLPCPSRA